MREAPIGLGYPHAEIVLVLLGEHEIGPQKAVSLFEPTGRRRVPIVPRHELLERVLALLDKVFVQGRVVFGMCVKRLPFL